jgi:glycerophosphoryl diester phosphodiesterase
MELKTLRARERIPQLRTTNASFDGQYEIPTLAEIIALVHTYNERLAAEAREQRKPAPRPIGLYPETKHPSYFRKLGKPLEEPLVEALRRAGLDSAQAPVFIQSFETGNLRLLKRMTQVRLIQLLEDQGAPYDLAVSGSATTYADLVTPPGLKDIATYAYGVGAAKELVIPRTADGLLGSPTFLVRDAHEHGLQVHAWTFRRENVFLPVNLRSTSTPSDVGALEQEIDAYLKAGIDGVFSDNPDIAVKARDQ